MNTAIELKGASEALRARLAESAEKNHRSLNQEALERLERSFELEDALVNERDQRWIDEAMTGEFHAGGIERLREIAARARGAAAA